MIRHSLASVLVSSALLLSLQACERGDETSEAGGEPALDTYEKRISYLSAYDFYAQASGNELPLDMETFQAGLKDAFSGRESRLTSEQAEATMDEFRERLANAPSNYEIGRVNVQEQVDYINENFLADNTVTIGSGLQYRVVEPGEGRRPTLDDKVRVRYFGRFIDGTVFDETEPGGEPRVFEVGEVIKGWQQALTMMEEGAIWELTVPPALGYGFTGKGQIPGNVVLLFRLELVEVIEAQADEAGDVSDAEETSS